MPRFAVLLRGVNVGTGHRVPMAAFRQVLGGLGYTDVRTLLNSGNAVLTSTGRSAARHAAAIADAVAATFGVVTPVIVKTAAEVEAIVADTPIIPAAGEAARYLVVFGPDEAALRAVVPLASLAEPPERLVVTPRAGYLYCPGGILQSKVGAAMLGRAGRGVTTRNWATVLKVRAALG